MLFSFSYVEKKVVDLHKRQIIYFLARASWIYHKVFVLQPEGCWFESPPERILLLCLWAKRLTHFAYEWMYLCNCGGQEEL